MPFISVIIPTYNRPAALAELLESLANQSFRDFETIIVNDAGMPVDSLVSLYPELSVRVVNMPVNGQHVRARNEGLRHASGEWIMLCDDDDLLLPGHIERMVCESEGTDGADFLFSDAEIVDFVWTDDRLTRMPVHRRLFAYEYDPPAMREFSTFIPSGCLYRRALHETIGEFDAEMFHYWDWDFFLRAEAACRVKRVACAGVLYMFGSEGSNMSGELASMRPYLDLLSAKHGLGPLPVKNFFLLLEEPTVRSRETQSEIVWDGQPTRSRYAMRQI